MDDEELVEDEAALNFIQAESLKQNCGLVR